MAPTILRAGSASMPSFILERELRPPLLVFSGFCSSMCLRLTLRLMSFSRSTVTAAFARSSDEDVRRATLLSSRPRVGVLEVVALGDLFVGLVERVLELVPLHFRDDVEARHVSSSSRSRRRSINLVGLHRDGRVAREAQQKRAGFADEVEGAADDDEAVFSRERARSSEGVRRLRVAAPA